ncbi:MAG: bacillithiol biosynthesis cysteine-adding enzyme BshC [Bacteroidota bacterium]|nr:bacillithiol biosynthesis cysteine-adding enzyme BshC [Bacteroidota bacterium]
MPITFQNSGYFSKIITDYLNQKKELKSFYGNFPTLENFKNQILQRKNNCNREVLVKSIRKQYCNINTSTLTSKNIELLALNNTFTITTGHQLNLFTGHLYFIYKIISTINLTQELQQEFPSYNFVPVYWMATEDHDFEEINHFSFNNNTISWNNYQGGAVGEYQIDGLDEVFEEFSKCSNFSKNADYLRNLFENTYLKHQNLADATRYLVNELFGKYGLVIIDANTTELKREFVPYIKKELLEQVSFVHISETIKQLSGYNIQIKPREINLFYLTENSRERIIKDTDENYKVLNTSLTFTPDELLSVVDSNPERFSPNVALRPVYQEVILPNICYIGGGGELAYWLELKSTFDAFKLDFPILLLRNSVLLISDKQQKKLEKLGVTTEDLFLKKDDLIKLKTQQWADTDIDFELLRKQIKIQIEQLRKAVSDTDISFIKAINAQEVKQLKSLDELEKKLFKANKKKLGNKLSRVEELHNQLFPNNNLQERVLNFSEFYQLYGARFLEVLFEQQKPLSQEFNIITL